MAQGEDTVPGTKRRKYVGENVAAFNVKLTPDDLLRINEVFPQGAAAGQRYSEQMLRLIDAA